MYGVTPVTVPTVQPQPPQQDKELAWVDEQIQAILPARVGVPDSAINSLSDPIKLKKPAPKEGLAKVGSLLRPPPKLGGAACITAPKVVEEPLRLKAVMNQSSALIGGKWYKVNDSVRGQTLTEIKMNSVVLTNSKNQKMVLFLVKDNKNINITTK